MPRVDLKDIKSEIGKWVVPITHGKLTYRYELFDNGTAHVYKSMDAVEHSYEIKDGMCSCYASQYGRSCKHLASVARI